MRSGAPKASIKDKVVCGSGDDTAKLDATDVIADATADDPNGSCEDVQRTGAQSESDGDSNSRSESTDGRNCRGKDEQSGSGNSQDDQADSQA